MKMKTFYRSEMNAPTNSSFSPSAGKPKAFLEYLKARGIQLQIEECFAPVSIDDLALAHDVDMVKDILSLRRTNGFGNKLKDVTETLPFTSGSFLAAARHAVTTGNNAFSPTSGFHHAGHAYNGGFCSFNGLMVAALKLKKERLVDRIGIIDCDQHYGDGTQDIIKKLKLDWIRHYTFGGDHFQGGQEWLSRFQKIIEKFKDVDVIFYQAGADCHILDPLGGRLTTDEMRLRDELVFQNFQRMVIPVAWNLAGGYQSPLEKVLELHKATYDLAA